MSRTQQACNWDDQNMVELTKMFLQCSAAAQAADALLSISLCCFWSAVSTAQSTVMFNSTFLFEAPPLFAPRPEDRTRLLSSSLRSFSGPPSFPSLFCTGMLGGSWEPEATLVSLGYLSRCSSSWHLAFYQPVLFLVCCFNSAERCQARFYVSLWGSSVVCVGDFENTIVPYGRPPKLHFENFNISYPLDLFFMLWEHDCDKYGIFKFFTTWLSLFNEYEIYGTTYEYIYTYIHTYIHTYRHHLRSTR